VLAFLIAIAAEPAGTMAVLIAPVLVLPFVWPLGFARNYAIGVALISTWILLLLDLAWGTPEAARALFVPRLADTALGCMLALLGILAVHLTGKRRATPA
jgi:uncharacterized membrane protein YccC